MNLTTASAVVCGSPDHADERGDHDEGGEGGRAPGKYVNPAARSVHWSRLNSANAIRAVYFHERSGRPSRSPACEDHPVVAPIPL